MNPIELSSPVMMSAKARAAEIIAILAVAILRTHLEKTEKQRAVDLGFPLDQSVHTTPHQQENLS